MNERRGPSVDGASPDGLSERADAYLAGALGDVETRAFEGELNRPEVARALAEAILLGDLLRGDPALDVPAGLASRLADGLPAGMTSDRRAAEPSTWRAVLGSLAWAWRGPGLSASELAPDASVSGVRVGLSSLRYALGPLGLRRGRA